MYMQQVQPSWSIVLNYTLDTMLGSVTFLTACWVVMHFSYSMFSIIIVVLAYAFLVFYLCFLYGTLD